MASETRPTKLRSGDDGVKITRTPAVRTSIWLLAIAVGLACVSLLLFVRPFLRQGPEQIAAASPRKAAAPLGAAPQSKPAAPKPAVHLEPVRGGQEKPAAGAAAPLPEKPAAAPSAAAAHNPMNENSANEDDGDEPSGIALFPPPGTNPPKSGIIVPDEFELPPGYMRHYQSTDDGERLAPILVFHPDFRLVDDEGQPLPMPADRVVPADMAPPGLAIEMLQIPDSQGSVGEGDADPGQDAAP